MAEDSRSHHHRHRRVAYAQLEALSDALEQHRSLATGYNKGCQAREASKRLWEAVAINLNSYADGATKDWKGWSKYWTDYKSKLKQKVAALRRSNQRTGGGPADEKPLTELEEKFLLVLGEGFGSGLPGVRVEPFEDIITEETNPDPDTLVLNPSIFAEEILPISPQAGSSSSPQPEPSAQQNDEPTSITPRSHLVLRHSTSAHTHQRLSTKPQRKSRRHPPLSIEAARRELVASSQARLALSTRKTTALETLVEEVRQIKVEIKEIKDTILSRLA